MGNIRLQSKVSKDQYTDYIQETFDLSIEDTCAVDIPNNLHIENLGDWSIGVICGASGSGKSTVLKSIGNGKISDVQFDCSKSVIANFDHLSPKDATMVLSSMGLASVPTWIRPFNVLSNGEQYRAKMALLVSRAKEGDVLLVDEYTSVVDRNVAKSMSYALQKYIRARKIKIVLATCHYDILDWLMADWLYDMNKGGVLERGDRLRRGRPKIELNVFRTTSDTWNIFKKHHYMTSDMNSAAACYCFTWEGQLVGFVSVLPQPSGAYQNAFRGSRTVVLPDFQGMGLGREITEFVGGIYRALGRRYFTKTVNPRLGEYRNKSTRWKPTVDNGKYGHQCKTETIKRQTRISYCHEYIGEPIYGYENITKSMDSMRYDAAMKDQLSLFTEDDFKK